MATHATCFGGWGRWSVLTSAGSAPWRGLWRRLGQVDWMGDGDPGQRGGIGGRLYLASTAIGSDYLQ